MRFNGGYQLGAIHLFWKAHVHPYSQCLGCLKFNGSGDHCRTSERRFVEKCSSDEREPTLKLSERIGGQGDCFRRDSCVKNQMDQGLLMTRDRIYLSFCSTVKTVSYGERDVEIEGCSALWGKFTSVVRDRRRIPTSWLRQRLS